MQSIWPAALALKLGNCIFLPEYLRYGNKHMLKVFLKYEVSKDKTDKLRLSNLNSQTPRPNLFGYKQICFDMNIFFNFHF